VARGSVQEPMATTQANPQERIARERLTQRPTFIGVDGEGGAHYWSSYEQTVVVVEGRDAETVKLAETPFATLGEWCEYTHDERGWEIGPHVGGSLVGELVRAVEA